MIHCIHHSATGVSHSRSGRPNQDAARVQRVDADTWVIAVSDGHGSARHADVGARFAAEVAAHRLALLWGAHRDLPDAVDTCREVLADTEGAAICTAWRHAIEAILGEARDAGVKDSGLLKPFGATLLGAIVRPDGALTLQLGDGAAWLMSGEAVARARVESALEAIGDATESLSLRRPERDLIVRWLPREAGQPATLLVATDGFQKSYPSDDAAETFMKGVHGHLTDGALAQVRDQLPRWVEQMATRGAGDDTTIVMAYWEAEPAAADAPETAAAETEARTETAPSPETDDTTAATAAEPGGEAEELPAVPADDARTLPAAAAPPEAEDPTSDREGATPKDADLPDERPSHLTEPEATPPG